MGVNHALKHGRGVPESEWHDCWFEQSFIGLEGGFRFIAFPETDIVISGTYIDLREESGILD